MGEEGWWQRVQTFPDLGVKTGGRHTSGLQTLFESLLCIYHQFTNTRRVRKGESDGHSHCH